MDDSTRLSREAHARALDYFAANPTCMILHQDIPAIEAVTVAVERGQDLYLSANGTVVCSSQPMPGLQRVYVSKRGLP